MVSICIEEKERNEIYYKDEVQQTGGDEYQGDMVMVGRVVRADGEGGKGNEGEVVGGDEGMGEGW